jgi:hypothetical protein
VISLVRSDSVPVNEDLDDQEGWGELWDNGDLESDDFSKRLREELNRRAMEEGGLH